MPLSETFRESLVLLVGSAAMQTFSMSQTIQMVFLNCRNTLFHSIWKKNFVMKFLWEMIG